MYPEDRERVLWWARTSLPRIEVVVEQIPDGEFQLVALDLANQELVRFMPRYSDLHVAMRKGLDLIRAAWDDMEEVRSSLET